MRKNIRIVEVTAHDGKYFKLQRKTFWGNWEDLGNNLGTKGCSRTLVSAIKYDTLKDAEERYNELVYKETYKVIK